MIEDIIHNLTNIPKQHITGIRVNKNGMTNTSYIYSAYGEAYIIRIPGEGTDKLINRRGETEVYEQLKGKNIADDVVYINPETGIKISKYIPDARTCSPYNWYEVENCMEKLRVIHANEIEVQHNFELFDQIEYYEKLRNGKLSKYNNYYEIKRGIWDLQDYIKHHESKRVLAHIDAIPDNFLFSGGQLFLIDWEYAGMQDPHIDVAMFCIYSKYDRTQVDRIIDMYFQGKCPREIRIKIYCYIAACSLLWSNWCEYKSSLGVVFEEYATMQYEYATTYLEVAKKEIEEYE